MPKPGFRHSEESKSKMSKTRKGVTRPERSPDWCANISRANKGIKKPRVLVIECASCGETDPEKMVKDKRNTTGFARGCKSCDTARNRERYKERFRLRAYNVTNAQVDAMYEAQGAKCAMCGLPVPKPARHISVIDHDHATGKVRGIIHHKCNLLLGHAKANIEMLVQAIDYLIKSNM